MHTLGRTFLDKQRVDPPEFDSYKLPPVSSLDTNGDGFDPNDAYVIFSNKRDWKSVSRARFSELLLLKLEKKGVCRMCPEKSGN